MIDARFYESKGPATAAALAAAVGLTVSSGDPEKRITSLASAPMAGPDDLTFLELREDDAPPALTAGVCFVSAGAAARQAGAATLIEAPSPRSAFGRAARLLFAARELAYDQPAIHPEARIAEGARLGPGCVVGPGAAVGKDARIGPNAVIGPGVQIGARSFIGATVSVRCALIGDDVTILPGAVIGETGFGLASDKGVAVLTPHFGRVIIQNGGSIGANCCIDRGLFDDTVLGEGVHIDNLCHIAHNVHIGSNTVMAAFAGVSGSVQIGDGVMFGGRVGIADHVKIGNNARLGAGAAVMRDVPAGETHAGYPAKPIVTWMRELAWLGRESQKRPTKAKQ
ncbi:MAG: UDP-3-O-(3-hydroxymyristoyl)glucosamine N-acyltransferase [Alphaproteobacteria bacterium]|nr:UDP-3-O-(3-hydroxymyristoyl)glucosamine N-acyltransferase [Alphaproteobacteria bacterium]